MRNGLKIKLDKIYYLAFIIRFSSSILLSSYFGDLFHGKASVILDVFNVIVIFLLVSKFFLQRYDIENIKTIAFISFFILISTLKSGRLEVLLSWLFIICAKDISLEKIARWIVKLTCLIFPLISFLAIMGVIENTEYQRLGTITRYSVGFSNPNTVGAILLQFTLAYLYSKKGRIHAKGYCLLTAIVLFCRYVNNSRSATALIVLAIFLNVFYIERKKSFFWLYKICQVMWIVLPLFSIYYATNYRRSNLFLALYNRVTAFRAYYANQFYRQYGISLFGNNGVDLSKRYLDNSYLFMLIIYGIIVLLLYILGMIILTSDLKRKNKNLELLILFLYGLYGMAEARTFVVTNCFIIILLKDIIYRADYIKNKELIQ